LKINGKIVRIDESIFETISIEEIKLAEKENKLHLVVDRIVVKKEDDFYNRLGDAVGTAFFEGKGNCFLENLTDDSISFFSNKFELDGMTFLTTPMELVRTVKVMAILLELTRIWLFQIPRYLSMRTLLLLGKRILF
jgi:excinuclease ABC subunit A